MSPCTICESLKKKKIIKSILIDLSGWVRIGSYKTTPLCPPPPSSFLIFFFSSGESSKWWRRGAVPLSGQWRGGDRAVCRCAAGNGHLLSPCGHCHNRQWNLRAGACPQRKAPLCVICGPWPVPLCRGECLHLKLDVYDSMWSSWERPYYAVPTPVKKHRGCQWHDRSSVVC